MSSIPPPSTAPGAELALPITDEGLAQRLRERMAVVEAALFEHAQSRAPFVTEAAWFDGKTESPDGRFKAVHGRLVVATPPEARRIQQLWTWRHGCNTVFVHCLGIPHQQYPFAEM